MANFHLGNLLDEGLKRSENLQNPTSLLVGAALVLGSYYLLKPNNQLKLNAPGPFLHKFPLNPKSIEIALSYSIVHEKLDEFCDQFQEVGHVNLFGDSTIVISKPDLIRKILGNREIFQNHPSFRRCLSYSLGQSSSMFASEGEVWKLRHKVLEPMHKLDFLKFHVKTISTTLAKITELVAQKIEKENNCIDFIPVMQRSTIDIIGQAVFGLDFGVVTSDYKDLDIIPPLAKNFLVLLDAISRRLQMPEVFWPVNYYLSGERKAALEMKTLFTSFLEEHKKKMEEGRVEEDKKSTLLHLILDFKEKNPELAEQVYPEGGIIQECFSFFGAGHDTTTNTSCFLLWHLAQFPELQQKVYEEIASVVEGKGPNEIPSYEDINGLEYTGMFIKESQRILPTVSSLPRYTTEDIQIDGINFPKGTQVLLAVKKIQNSEKSFEDHSSFDPERWRSIPKDAPFYAFGHGIRMCFGQKLAILEMKILLYTLLSKYKLEFDPQHLPEVEFTFGIVPKHKQAWVKLIPRNA